MDLQDKVAVVTGASRGLGRAFSAALIDRGAAVYGLARSTDDLEAVRDDLGDRFHPVACDVTDRDAVADAIGRVEREAGRCDVLINNAGLGQFGAVEDLDAGEVDVQIDVNLRGVVTCTQAVVPMMKRQNKRDGFGGHIVNIASVAGLVGNPSISVYNLTKFGVRGFSEAIMKELRDDRIKVTCVYPGSVDTHFASVAGTSGAPGAMRPEDVASTVIHVLEGSPNYLVSEVMMRPLRPKG